MEFFQKLSDVFTNSLQSVWGEVARQIPNLVIALVFLAIGWILAILIQRLIEHLFKTAKIDVLLKGAGIEDVLKKAGHELDSGYFVGMLVKWFIIVVFLMSSFDTLGLVQFSDFLRQVVSYIPNIIAAVLIMMAAVIVGNTIERIVIASSRATDVHAAEMLGHTSRWAIWIFAAIIALKTLGIDTMILSTIVTAVFAGLALALGLSFGLGGKDYAQKVIERTMKRWEDK